MTCLTDELSMSYSNNSKICSNELQYAQSTKVLSKRYYYNDSGYMSRTTYVSSNGHASKPIFTNSSANVNSITLSYSDFDIFDVKYVKYVPYTPLDEQLLDVYHDHHALSAETVCWTSVQQDVENTLLNFVYELGTSFVQSVGNDMDSYLYNKCYDIAKHILQKALKNDYYLSADTTESDIVDAIISNIDFYSCYKIIDDTLGIPHETEKYLAVITTQNNR